MTDTSNIHKNFRVADIPEEGGCEWLDIRLNNAGWPTMSDYLNKLALSYLARHEIVYGGSKYGYRQTDGKAEEILRLEKLMFCVLGKMGAVESRTHFRYNNSVMDIIKRYEEFRDKLKKCTTPEEFKKAVEENEVIINAVQDDFDGEAVSVMFMKKFDVNKKIFMSFLTRRQSGSRIDLFAPSLVPIVLSETDKSDFRFDFGQTPTNGEKPYLPFISMNDKKDQYADAAALMCKVHGLDGNARRQMDLLCFSRLVADYESMKQKISKKLQKNPDRNQKNKGKAPAQASTIVYSKIPDIADNNDNNNASDQDLYASAESSREAKKRRINKRAAAPASPVSPVSDNMEPMDTDNTDDSVKHSSVAKTTNRPLQIPKGLAIDDLKTQINKIANKGFQTVEGRKLTHKNFKKNHAEKLRKSEVQHFSIADLKLDVNISTEAGDTITITQDERFVENRPFHMIHFMFENTEKQ